MLGIKPGDRVLTTPLSAFATTLAIIGAGARPVFVDTDDSGLIDLGLCESFLRHNADVKFFVPVHLYGHSLNLEHLRELRDRYGLRIVEDCAQAHGASWNGIACGSIGQIAATSFYPTKNLGALGDAGALLTNDGALESSARVIRDYGQSSKYVHETLGLNSRLDEIQAAILHDAFLPRLDDWTRSRRSTASAYLEGIRSVNIRFMQGAEDSRSSWHLFPVASTGIDRDELRTRLHAADVATGVHYPSLITEQPALTRLTAPEVATPLEKSTRIARTQLSLPVHPFMTDGEVSAVIRAVTAL